MVKKEEIIPIVVFILMFLAVWSIALPYAYAEHDYIQPFMQWDVVPDVCLIGIPSGDLWQTIRATDSWKKAMRDYTGTNDWDYNISITDWDNLEGCRVVIQHKITGGQGFERGDIIGQTICLDEVDVCLINIDRVDAEPFYYNTIVHEMGHALGLGHRLGHNVSGFATVMDSNDIMFPQVKQWMHITKADLDALIYFNNIDPHRGNYTVPHLDTWD